MRQAHIDYMKDNLSRVIASGGLLSDDGKTLNGGLMVLETDDRSEAEAFVAGDPFFAGGVYDKYTVNRWRKAFLDFKSYI